MPPERWIVEIKPAPETFGATVRRLRRERGWSQRDMARLTGYDQTEVSKFERDSYRYKKEDVVAAFEDAFGLTRGALAHLPWGDGLRDAPAIPGPSVAIPHEPALIEAVEAMYPIEPEDMPDLVVLIRKYADNRQRDRKGAKRTA